MPLRKLRIPNVNHGLWLLNIRHLISPLISSQDSFLLLGESETGESRGTWLCRLHTCGTLREEQTATAERRVNMYEAPHPSTRLTSVYFWEVTSQLGHLPLDAEMAWALERESSWLVRYGWGRDRHVADPT